MESQLPPWKLAPFGDTPIGPPGRRGEQYRERQAPVTRHSMVRWSWDTRLWV